MLGITVSVGLRSLRADLLAKAIAAADAVLMAEGTEKKAIGDAGEAVAQVILEDELAKTTGGRVFNLNQINKNFPVLDVVSSKEVKSVKTFGALAKGPYQYKNVSSDLLVAFRELMGMQEHREMRGYPQKVQKLQRAAQLIWDGRGIKELCEAEPVALRSASSVKDVYVYLLENGRMTVARDQVIPFRADAALCLNGWSAMQRCRLRSAPARLQALE